MMRIMATFLRCLAALFLVIPKKSRVAFLSRQDDKLSLDYRMLIDNLKNELDERQIIVCLTKPETKNIPSFIAGTIKQLYYARTSKVIVIDGYVPAVCIPKKNADTTVIQLWHALGAIKKFGYQCLDTPAGRTSSSAQAACMHKNYDYIIAGGSGAIPAFAEAFNYPENIILPLGLPRMDYLIDSNPNSERCIKAQEIEKQFPFLSNEKETVLYAPTLRKGSGYEGWLNDYLEHLAQEYQSKDINLIIAGHPLNKDFDISLLDKYPFIKFVPGVATIDLIGFADCVISDYSAVVFEACLAKKPVLFYTPDIDIYRQSPGLNIEPNSISQAYLDDYLSNTDFGSTERISNLIKKSL